MKNFYPRIYFLIILLFSNVIAFATTASGELEDTPEDDAPINTRIIWLVVAGIAFAFYYYSTQRKKQID